MPPPRRHPLNPRAQRIRGGRHERAVSRGHNAQGLAGLERRIPHPIDNLRARCPESGGSAPCSPKSPAAAARLVWRSTRGRRAPTVPPDRRNCLARRDRRKATRRSWPDHPAAGRRTSKPTPAADEGHALRRTRRRARTHLHRKSSGAPAVRHMPRPKRARLRTESATLSPRRTRAQHVTAAYRDAASRARTSDARHLRLTA